MAWPGANVYITHLALSFKYAFGSVFVLKRLSAPFESVAVYVARKATISEDEDAACCEVQRHGGDIE